MAGAKESNYYLTIRAKMMREFRAMYKGARKVLARYFSEREIDRLEAESKKEYQELFPQLPYIGGKKNSETINLIMGAIVLAIIRPLEKESLTKRQIGRVIHHTFEGYFSAKPRIIQRALGRLVSSKLALKRLKAQIETSGQRGYEDDFLMEYVEPRSGEFDFGYDYTQCALQKLFARYGAEEYLPYVCLGDYALFRSLGVGFSRTRTIAHGAPKCDFRFKRKGRTARGWPPEGLEEWSGKN